MSDLRVGELRAALEAKLSAIQESLKRRDAIMVERAADPSDEAQSAIDRELGVLDLDRESGVLRAVRSAMRRIDRGTFGVCLSCDGTISEKRLAAVPWAEYCLACQEQADAAPQHGATSPLRSLGAEREEGSAFGIAAGFIKSGASGS